MNIKPNKLAFLFAGFGIKLFIIIFIIGIFIPQTFMGLLLALLIIAYELGKYKKEKYEILDNKIIRHFGDWFNDNSVEVQYKRIVEVRLTLPFIENLIFKTGKIIISTAGGGDSIYILSVDRPEEVYNQILNNLNKNGYNLGEGDLVMDMRPSILGVAGEVASKIINIQTIYIFFILIALSNELKIASYIAIIFGIYILIIFTISYLDLKKRVYKLYTDRIEYFEGFLTKHHAIIPIEAISDVENTQSFFSRIMGIHDIIISSKGATNNIILKNMTHGEKFIESIKYIKDQIHENSKNNETSDKSVVKHSNKIEQKVLNYNKDYTATFKMNKLKALLSGIILLPSLPAKLLQMIFTTYKVDKTSIEYTFDFLSKKHASFNIENITKVSIKRSILDKWLGTCSLSFYSLGASFPINFSDITYSEDLEKNILEKVGISDEKILNKLEPKFNFKNFILSNISLSLIIIFIALFIGLVLIETLGGSVFVIMLVIAIIIIGLLYVYNKYLYSDKYFTANLRENYIEAKKGIIVSTHSFAHINNIKGITSTKLPTTNIGNLSFNIAGETISTNSRYTYILSNSISIEYIENVYEYHNAFDKFINGGKLDTKEILSSKPVLINYILPLVIIGILTIMMGLGFIILFIILPITIWQIKVQKYIIENNRTLFAYGIIYKSRQTILHGKIDFIKLERGILNKMFGNGNVDIYTTGSTNVDMSLKNTKDYQKIYEILKEYTE